MSQVVTANMTGQWSMQGQRDGRVRLKLEPNGSRAWVSTHLALTQFQGLTAEQLLSTTSPVNFRLVREAGTFTFSGSFHERAGTGQWRFNADPAFVSLLRQHGYEQPTSEELYALAVGDVRGSYIADLERAGYQKLPISQLVSLYTNDVSAEYINSLQSAGYSAISPNELVALRSNDVSVPYIKSLGDMGYKGLTTAQLIALRTNGVTRDFIERLQKGGQKNLSVERLLSLRTNPGIPD
ncbi:MAG TPA: hypothetical protein VF088_05385 [Pyrinomonadaceae bacterium]